MRAGVNDPAPIVRFAPEPGEWLALMEGGAGLADEARLFRGEMGLPIGPKVVLTGHQARFWHAGILAKYDAAEALARMIGGEAAWLVVDQDEASFDTVEYPVLDRDGRLTRAVLRLAPAPGPGVAAASCPVFAPGALSADSPAPALECVREGLSRITAALRRHQDQPTAARQVGEATGDLLSEGLPRRATIYATELARTTLFARLLESMRSDPVAMARAYNEAAIARPDSGIAGLRIQDGRVELPLWRIEPGPARRRVWSDDPALGEVSTLAPRALLMTGMLRLGGCELFIHGAGGALYDLVTEAWFEGWLGERLAPTAMVSADLPLPLDGPAVSEAEVARAKWLAHRARHDPGVVGDLEKGARKREMARRVREAGQTDRAAGFDAYRRMHLWLDVYRAERRADLARLEGEAASLGLRRGDSAIARDRTWAFALHDRASLEGLREKIAGALSGAVCRCGAEGAG